MAEELKQSVEEIKEDTLQTTQQEEPQAEATEIGRASCRERVSPYV